MSRFTHSFPIRPVVIGVLYGVAATATILLTRFDGGVAHLWVATAVLLAELTIAPKRRWTATLVACGLASLIATTLFGFGLGAALPLVLINLGEALLCVALLQRLMRGNGYLESIASVAFFALAVGAAGPALSGFAGAAVAAWASGVGYWESWSGWVIGHGLGTLTFAPVATMLLRGEVGQWLRGANRAMKAEAAALILTMIAVSWLVFAQTGLPLLFAPMLPLMVITFRLGRPGAAGALVMLTLVGGILTARGFGPINMIHGSVAERSAFFQLYLATTTLTVLPIAAELRHRKVLFQRLQESEARYKLITDSATDMLATFDLDGIIRYASPSTAELSGFAPDQVVGRPGRDFVDPRDLEIVIDAHHRSLAELGATCTAVYRGPTNGMGTRWFEARARGIADEAGRPIAVVCAIRDISERKRIEARLSHAASTDPLTGLANRRAFDRRLDNELAAAMRTGAGGCVAIFDLDHFKQVNDRHGHAAGDAVLRAFAAAALKIMPREALVARIGGEEFGVVLPHLAAEHAADLCNRLRRATARLRTDIGNGTAVAVTVSAGIADFTDEASRVELMRAADHALYTAKAAGRDRLRIAA
ncbi:MAG TPA: diguanylate cyclase [Sphingomonas sp.]|nr:diguanylate cyclase [Sphingomonas sp.]